MVSGSENLSGNLADRFCCAVKKCNSFPKMSRLDSCHVDAEGRSCSLLSCAATCPRNGRFACRMPLELLRARLDGAVVEGVPAHGGECNWIIFKAPPNPTQPSPFHDSMVAHWAQITVLQWGCSQHSPDSAQSFSWVASSC